MNAIFAENEVYKAVISGELEIGSDGTVWRVGARRADRWTGTTKVIPCSRRRAELVLTTGYLMVRVMFNGRRWHAAAHRLVYLHFYGPIPAGKTINHKNGVKGDNRPENLELATPREQIAHARNVLGRHGSLTQWGGLNHRARLTTEQVEAIKERRSTGEALLTIAADYGVRFQHISRIARGDRRSRG